MMKTQSTQKGIDSPWQRGGREEGDDSGEANRKWGGRQG